MASCISAIARGLCHKHKYETPNCAFYEAHMATDADKIAIILPRFTRTNSRELLGHKAQLLSKTLFAQLLCNKNGEPFSKKNKSEIYFLSSSTFFSVWTKLFQLSQYGERPFWASPLLIVLIRTTYQGMFPLTVVLNYLANSLIRCTASSRLNI